MRKIPVNNCYRVILVVVAGLISFGPAGSSVSAVDGVSFKFDKRHWRIGYQAANDRASIVEYVLPGETVENWTELVTIQKFTKIPVKIIPEEFMQRLKKTMTNRCPSTVWQILRKYNNAILYQWRTQGCKGTDDQHEIAKLQQHESGFYRFSYVSKKIPLKGRKIKLWQRLVGDATARE